MEEVTIDDSTSSNHFVLAQSNNPSEMKSTVTEHDLFVLKNLFERVLVSEILQEIKFSQDVIAKRAGRRKEYIENRAKLILQLLNIPLGAVNLVGTLFPPAKVVTAAVSFAGQTVLKVADIVTDKIGDNVSAKAQSATQKNAAPFPGFQLQDFVLLKAHLDVFAEQASFRYEPFFKKQISEKPLEGVIPLARVAARRVMDYLGRVGNYYSETSLGNLSFTDLCLEGLILGRSGKKKEGYGFKNNPIVVRNPKVSKYLKKPVKYSAEGILSRTAVTTLQATDTYGVQHPIFYRTKPLPKIGDSLLQDKKDRKYDYAVTKLLDEKQPNLGPKYEHMLVNAETSQRYGFDQGSDGSAQFVGEYSLSTHKSSVYFATFDELCTYSDYYAEQRNGSHREKKEKEELDNQPMSFIDWIKNNLIQEVSQHIHSVWVLPFKRNIKADVDVLQNPMSLLTYLNDHHNGNPKGIKATHTLSGNFTGVSLKHLDFRGVTLQDMNLDLADCRFSLFTECKLSYVSMNSTKLACADLKRVVLSHCIVYGALWELAAIEGMVDVTNKETIAEIKKLQIEESKEFFMHLSQGVEHLEKIFGEKIDHVYGLVELQNQAIDQLELHLHELRQQSYDKYQDYEHFKVYVLNELESTRNILAQLSNTVEHERKATELLDAKVNKLSELYEQINQQQKISAEHFQKLVQSFLKFKASMDRQIVDLRAEFKKQDSRLSLEFIGIEGENKFEADELRPVGAKLTLLQLAKLTEKYKDKNMKFVGAKNFVHIGPKIRLFAPTGFEMKDEETVSLEDPISPEPRRLNNDRQNLKDAKDLMSQVLHSHPDFATTVNGREYKDRLSRYENILANNEFLPENRSENLKIIVEELNNLINRLYQKKL